MSELLLLIDRLKPYGAERVCIDLATEFSSIRSTTVVTFGADQGQVDVENQPWRRLRIERSRWKPLAMLQVIWRLRCDLKKRGDVLVFSFMPLSNIIALVSTIGMPVRVVATEHNISAQVLQGLGLKRQGLRFLRRVLYRRAHAIIAVSRAVEADLIDTVGVSELVHVIYNPVNLARLQAQLAATTGVPPFVRALRASREDVKVIVIVGALKHAKGHDIAIRALSLTPDNVHLVCVGDGAERMGIKRLADTLGVGERLHLVGAVQQVGPWMKAADLVLVPSRYEGFGLVAVEAAGLGVQVLVTDVPGLREVGSMVGTSIVNAEPIPIAEESMRILSLTKRNNTYCVDRFLPAQVAKNYLLVAGEVVC
ncbi:glycosyltransferase [Blastococcus saxobsidens]|uniref:Glycosyltransferase n=1 Tax=Blastococcus saxobsidens TaxID=138336 RepID=A0A6L9VWP7_9ACTN|nr:glycosyltransferase [Blastococcus saxobsidens]NEK84256.1 glycosyltransferase [Blastococcus saxobsidens]